MARSITDFVIRIKVEGQGLVDKLKTSVDNVDKSVKKATGSSDKLDTALKGLGGTLKSNISTGNNFADSILDSIGGMGRYANAIALASAAVIGLGTRAVLLADQIQDVANSTGIAAGALLNFRNSIVEAGGDANDFETIANKLNITLGEAAEGSDKARNTFRKLGVDLGDAKGNLRNTGDILRDTIRALQQIPDPALRASLAVEAMGKSAAQIDWQNVQAFNDQFKDEQIAQLSKYKGAIDELSNSISTKLVTAFGRTAIEINKITSVIKKNEEEANKVGKTFEDLPGTGRLPGIGVSGLLGKEAIDSLNAYFKIFATEIPKAERDMLDFAETVKRAQQMNLFGKGKEDTGELKLSKDTLDAIGLQLYKQEQDRKKAAQTEKELADLTYQQGLNHFNNNLQLEDQQRNTEQLRNLFADIVLLNNVLSTEGAMKQLAAQNELIGLYGREYEYKQELLAIDAERQNTIDQINQNLILMGDAVQQSDIARAEREIELAQYVADERLRIFLDGLEKQKAAEENVPSTLNRFFDDLARSANPAIVALNKADSVLNNMRTSLDEFATTGKFKFKNFALSVIRDLLMVEAQAKLTLLFSSIGKAFMGALNPAAIPIPGKAMGGPVTGNSPYVVGEKGPELFIPKSSGTIIPNDKMSGNQSSGGPVTNVYNNYSISAIDSQSVAQFFAQNRKMALGAVTMAQKELSYGS